VLAVGRRLALAVLVLLAPAAAQAQVDVPLADGLTIEEAGSNTARQYPELVAAFPAPAVRFDLGEIYGLRDIQGGKVIPGYPQLNALSIGAGNARHPGRLEIGADVTRSIVFHVRRPGRRPRKMMEITPRGVFIYGRVRFR
jgi:hypothetical protein